MKKFLILLSLIASGCFDANAGNVSSACTWKPPKSVNTIELNGDAIYIEQSQKAAWKKNSDGDYLILIARGRSYFYSMPNIQCKSDVFIVQGDVVEYLQDYPVSGQSEFTRVFFFSKSLNSDVIGWIPSASLCRGTGSGDFGHCGVEVKK